jgi:hypothetical protein
VGCGTGCFELQLEEAYRVVLFVGQIDYDRVWRCASGVIAEVRSVTVGDGKPVTVLLARLGLRVRMHFFELFGGEIMDAFFCVFGGESIDEKL